VWAQLLHRGGPPNSCPHITHFHTTTRRIALWSNPTTTSDRRFLSLPLCVCVGVWVCADFPTAPPRESSTPARAAYRTLYEAQQRTRR
jgi:hypothetical protein